jgi:hypothetical protein
VHDLGEGRTSASYASSYAASARVPDARREVIASSRVLPGAIGRVTPHVMSPSLAKEGSVSRRRGQRRVPVCRSFSSEGSRFDHLEHVPDRVARRRARPRVPASPKMYPSRTREASGSRHCRQHYMPICRAFVQAL